MIKFYSLITLGFAMLVSLNSQAQRYVSEVFSDVTITEDVQYASNITVLTGAPSLEALFMDVYEPTGDTQAERPVVIIAHDGQYLPLQFNALTFGERKDSAIVHLCKSLAKRGFVAIAYDYRLGWNPAAFNQDDRAGTYINALYRATQDGFSLIRYLRMDAATQGNTFGLDTTRIISGGHGTGGQISAAMAFLNKPQELELTKFFNFSSNQFYVDTSLSGNVYGTQQRPLTIANNAGYSSEFHFAFNLGGSVGDSTWIEAGEVPMVSFGSANDPFIPHDFGPILVPTTGSFVIDVSGSRGIQRRQQFHGNNDAFSSLTYSDPYSAQADLINGGMDGLFPFIRPTVESSPWNYWDSLAWTAPHPAGGTYHENGVLTNPGMSDAKGQAHLDTVASYMCPRIVCALNLPGCPGVGLNEISSQDQFSLYPNPSAGEFVLRMENTASERTIRISDFSGKLVFEKTSNESEISVELEHTGIFVVSVYSDKGISYRRVVIQ